jgi:hypothetical protein
MSRGIVFRSITAGLVCVAALSACTNAPDSKVTATTIGTSIIKGSGKAKAPTAQQIAANVTKALAATDAQMILLTVPQRKAATVMQKLEQNRGYNTYGTADRRSVTLRSGMMTATRGLGNDLMSSNVDAVRALVSARRGGTAQRVMRYLDGEELTRVEVSNCTVRVGATSRVRVAEINTAATSVSETCQGDGSTFTNTYQVAPNGQIVQSRQWHGPANSYLTIQSLR